MSPTGTLTVRDERAVAAAPAADRPVAGLWADAIAVTSAEPPEVGLSAGERPAADVEVLAGLVAATEYELARRMRRALRSGSLPLAGPGAMLTARGWSVSWARRLARAGQLVEAFPTMAEAWGAGAITSEHVDAVARRSDRFTDEELEAVVAELAPRWGSWSPAAVERFVVAAARLLHPPQDPSPEEVDAHASRGLSFSVLGDTVLLTGELARVDGEMVIAALDAVAERLRVEADHTPASARRADALVELVNRAHAADVLPSRGGLPVSLTVTLDRTAAGDVIATTSRGHQLTEAETRWATCDATITPILTKPPACPQPATGSQGPAARIAALAAAQLDTREPLDVGRTQRTATAAQRRALAARDHGCIIPGCTIPAEACQVHHVIEWAAGGRTDTAAMVLLCWTHHRQVDLRMWTIAPRGTDHPTQPEPGAPAGTPWPANNAAPWTITRTPRPAWRT